MTVVTTTEAATLVGRSAATVRWWVNEGYVQPLRSSAKPLLFREEDIWRCARDRMSDAESARLDALWSRMQDPPS